MLKRKQFHHRFRVLSFQKYEKVLPYKFAPLNGKSNPNYAELAVVAKPCSNPIRALNNNLELSFRIDPNTKHITGFANLNNWIGTVNAKNRSWNECYQAYDSPGIYIRYISCM